MGVFSMIYNQKCKKISCVFNGFSYQSNTQTTESLTLKTTKNKDFERK